MKVGQVALEFGADDLDSVMIEENVVTGRGTAHRASTTTIRAIRRSADPCGVTPVLRRTRLELSDLHSALARK
jgi:cyclic dehypoxanthinyl futalosine synthase